MGIFTYVGVSMCGRSGPGLSAAMGPGDPMERRSLRCGWEVYGTPKSHSTELPHPSQATALPPPTFHFTLETLPSSPIPTGANAGILALKHCPLPGPGTYPYGPHKACSLTLQTSSYILPGIFLSAMSPVLPLPGPAYPCCLCLTLFSDLLQATVGVTPNRLGNSHQDPFVGGAQPESPSVSPAKWTPPLQDNSAV